MEGKLKEAITRFQYNRRGFLKAGLISIVAPGFFGRLLTGNRFPMGRGKKVRGIVTFFITHREELDLSDSQVAQLKSIREQFRKISARLNADIETAHEELSDILKEDEIKVAEAEEKIKKLCTLEGELRIEFSRAIAEGKKVLTKEQLKKAKELMKEGRA